MAHQSAHRAQPGTMTDRNLALELVRVTEAAAIAASHWIGLGKKNEADGAAVEAMRKALDAVAINGYGFRDSRICLDWCNSRETKAILMTETTAADKPRLWMREFAKRILLRRFDVAICGGQRHRGAPAGAGPAAGRSRLRPATGAATATP